MKEVKYSELIFYAMCHMGCRLLLFWMAVFGLLSVIFSQHLALLITEIGYLLSWGWLLIIFIFVPAETIRAKINKKVLILGIRCV